MNSLAIAVLAIAIGTPPSTPAAAPTAFRVEVSGAGRPMILIPGLTSAGAVWQTTVAHFATRYTCHVLTLAGFAGVATAGKPLLTTVVADLAQYIEAENLERPVVIGHSLGGNIALDIASRIPARVGPIVLVDSLPFYAAAWFSAKTSDDAKPAVAAMRAYQEAQTKEQYEQGIRSGAATKFMVTSQADLQTIIQWGHASDRNTAIDAMAELLLQDLRPQLSRISSPTLVLGTWVGLRDQMSAGNISITRASVTKTFEEQFAALPRLHFALTDSARHFIMLDQPAWFLRQLDAFLAAPEKATEDRGFAP